MKKRGIAFVLTMILGMAAVIPGCVKAKENVVTKAEAVATQETVSEIAPEKAPEKAPEAEEETARVTTPETVVKATPEAVSAQAEPTPENEKASEAPVQESTTIASPSQSGALHVEGTQLTDSNGKAVQLRGISTHGLAWFPEYVNRECFKQLREEWNVNVVRLAMYTAEYGGYCAGGNKEELKALVKNGVEYAKENDMYVIIDWHILSDNNPNTYKEEAKSFFDEISAQYAGYNNVIYEICNEPNGGTEWQAVKSYAEEVIGIIRSHDEDGIILVGTPNWSQYVDRAAADPITGYDNIMYTLHFYAATHKDDLRNTMTAAIDNGLPIFVSEYGICDAGGNGAIDEEQAKQWVDTMNAYGVSYVAWNLSNKNETSAIISSSCTKTSGFAEGDLSNSGKWLYRLLTGKAPSSETGKNTGDLAAPPKDQDRMEEEKITVKCGDLDCIAEVKNSWESNGKFFYQYELNLLNNSDSEISGWNITIKFNDTVTLSDGWCGNYSVEDKVLNISSVDYNGNIKAGETMGNIGFIISGSKDLQIDAD